MDDLVEERCKGFRLLSTSGDRLAANFGRSGVLSAIGIEID